MRSFAAPLCVVVLAACTVGPNYRPPEAGTLSVPDTYYQRPARAQPADLARWWERFDDPLLTRLFDVGINLISFSVSALIGVVFGYFPARRAAALNPIDARRHE